MFQVFSFCFVFYYSHSSDVLSFNMITWYVKCKRGRGKPQMSLADRQVLNTREERSFVVLAI